MSATKLTETRKQLACQECGRPIRRDEPRGQSAGDKMPTCWDCCMKIEPKAPSE